MSVLDKLITDEDPFHIHKLHGIYCLCNYFFQFTNYYYHKTMILNPYILAPHIMLHVTSFVFQVLSRRPVTNDGKIISKMSMFIWSELRLHSLLFGWRSCFSIIFPEYSVLIVFATMILADIATWCYGTPNITTVRGNNLMEKKSMTKIMYSSFFSTSQMGATIICAGFFMKSYEPNPVLVFCTLPAIQTSAFGMTLLRKNIITKEIWQLIYSLELILVYVFWFLEYENLDIAYYSILAYTLRFNGLSKYLIWTAFYLVNDYLHEQKFPLYFFMKEHNYF